MSLPYNGSRNGEGGAQTLLPSLPLSSSNPIGLGSGPINPLMPVRLEASPFFCDFSHSHVHLLSNFNGTHLFAAAGWSSLSWTWRGIPDRLPEWLQRSRPYPHPLHPAVWAGFSLPISAAEFHILSLDPSRTCSMRRL